MKKRALVMETFLLVTSLACSMMSSAHATEAVEVAGTQYRLRLDGASGDIQSMTHRGRELIHRSERPRALFAIRLRDADGRPVDVNALMAGDFSIRKEQREGQQVLLLKYSTIAGRPVDVDVQVRCPVDGGMTFWRMSVRNRAGLMMDHIDFPTVVTPNDLVATGGDGRIFWPAMEGALVEDIDLREKGPWRYQPIEHPNMGWLGLYPSSCPMQFMAHYGKTAGLYLAAHDEQCHPKGIEYHPHPGGGIQLDYRLFPGAVTAELWDMPYEMALGVFDGDWHDAAEIYRTWRDGSKMPRPPRLQDNPAIPAWFEKSPVVVTYPVRGERDLGDMSPNEYFPYTKAVEPLRRLGGKMGAPVLALLMHWEGSAPWSPPYVWPPYGGMKDFADFVKALHAEGNMLGLYASGVAYTTRSNTDPTYGMEKEFVDKKVFNYVNVAPDCKLAQNGVCAGPKAQRLGYDLCPANQWVQDVVVNEVEKILPSGVDYLQYFDQNLGGACCRCYARSHGHPPGPGVWQNEAMGRIFSRINEAVKASGRKVLIGCESAAAEPFIPSLLFNDLRFSINLRFAIPVPAYAYLNHEYVNNFMGNQNGVRGCVDNTRSPLNLHQRLAYAFVAGDMMTVVLRGGGRIGWDWGTPWEVPGPDHESVTTLIRNLNPWRTGAGKPYLVHGRMLKPLELRDTSVIPMISPKGTKLPFPSLFTSRWQNGRDIAQIVVNYTPCEQSCSLVGEAGQAVRVYHQPQAAADAATFNPQGELPLRLAPLTAVMVEFGRAEDLPSSGDRLKEASQPCRNLAVDSFRDHLKGGWIGQMAGVGWGSPTEMKSCGRIMPESEMPPWNPKMVNQYDNDDCYVEQTFVRTLELHGLDVSARQVGIDFANTGFPLFIANFLGRSNVRCGIAPPDSGHPRFTNKINDLLDYQIESDFSGLISPGCPNSVIALGDKFGHMMCYGDGVYGGQFVGGMYAEAYFEKDVIKVIEAGLKCIPEQSQYAEMVRDMLGWYRQDPQNWQKTWELVERKYHNDTRYHHRYAEKSIEVKLNGAYILMGLLYGKGDFEQTVRIACRCGQDSDCNPANAGGVLGAILGFAAVPERFKSALDEKRRFNASTYDWPGMLRVHEQLARQVVVKYGGQIERDAGGRERFEIPVQTAQPRPLEKSWEPGPVAGVKYSEEEVARMIGPIEKFAPGWKVKDCGGPVDEAKKYLERDNVLMTRPLSATSPCILYKKLELPAGKTGFLHMDVGHRPNEDWELLVKADGRELLKKTVATQTAPTGWLEVVVDLTPFAGKNVKLELLQQAKGNPHVAGYWAEIKMEYK